MPQSTFTVQGMTCGHCVSSVTEEVGDINGVRNVDVDLATGTLTVTSDRPVADEEIRAAVTEAGYQLAG
jgi:copper ion binding protein